ncbi:MAG: exodeoxyribonuclease VII small subunit [Betaproteobacteria bacterium]
MSSATRPDLPTAQLSPPSFEAALAELEILVANLEGGHMALADALTAYRRGALLLQYAQGQLQSAQEQVRILEGDLLKNFSEPAAGADGPGSPELR